MLVDLTGILSHTTVTTTGAQTLNNTATLPRYTDGAVYKRLSPHQPLCGCAATPNISITYTNSAGTGSRTTP